MINAPLPALRDSNRPSLHETQCESVRPGLGGLQIRLKQARFPALKTVDNFSFGVQASVKRTLLVHGGPLKPRACRLEGDSRISNTRHRMNQLTSGQLIYRLA
jgi:hypothetical protein